MVGGLAVAYWTSARYVTGDIDVLMPSVPEAYEVLDALGFNRTGRVWLLDDPRIVFEAPGSFPDRGDESDEIETPQGRKLTMLKAEDMALWRLREVVFWGAPDAIQQTLWLLEAPLLDRRRLEQRAHTEHLDGPLRELEAAAAAQSSAGVPFTDDELRELVVAMKRSYPLPT